MPCFCSAHIAQSIRARTKRGAGEGWQPSETRGRSGGLHTESRPAAARCSRRSQPPQPRSAPLTTPHRTALRRRSSRGRRAVRAAGPGRSPTYLPEASARPHPAAAARYSRVGVQVFEGELRPVQAAVIGAGHGDGDGGGRAALRVRPRGLFPNPPPPRSPHRSPPGSERQRHPRRRARRGAPPGPAAPLCPRRGRASPPPAAAAPPAGRGRAVGRRLGGRVTWRGRHRARCRRRRRFFWAAWRARSVGAFPRCGRELRHSDGRPPCFTHRYSADGADPELSSAAARVLALSPLLKAPRKAVRNGWTSSHGVLVGYVKWFPSKPQAEPAVPEARMALRKNAPMSSGMDSDRTAARPAARGAGIGVVRWSCAGKRRMWLAVKVKSVTQALCLNCLSAGWSAARWALLCCWHMRRAGCAWVGGCMGVQWFGLGILFQSCMKSIRKSHWQQRRWGGLKAVTGSIHLSLLNIAASLLYSAFISSRCSEYQKQMGKGSMNFIGVRAK